MLTENQQRIFDGLKGLGKSLANFYEDAVNMLSPECTILSKANMIAHAAREIDGGLRDVFAPNKIVKEEKGKISDGENKGNDHFASILAAVGKDDPKNTLAIEWFNVAKNFHRIGHRKNIHLETSVDPTEIISLWCEYEKVLGVVVGSFLGLSNRLDVLLKLPQPQQDSLPVLRNLLKNPRNSQYFFSRLDQPGWLKSLIEERYFDTANAPQKEEGSVIPNHWNLIDYLVTISPIARRNVKENLIAIIENIMAAYFNGLLELHPYTVSAIIQAIINIEGLSFTQDMKRFLEKYDSINTGYGWNLTHSVMADGLSKRLIEERDVNGVKGLLEYYFGFTIYNETAISIFGEDPTAYTKRKQNVEEHNIRELLSKHGILIVKLVGEDAIRIVMQKLSEIVKLKSFKLMDGFPTSIEPSDQSFYDNEWEHILVSYIRDFAPHLEKANLGNVIDEMIDSKVLILQRLAIHLIRTHFGDFSDKWWKYVNSTGKDDEVYIHEPYILLRDHSNTFSDKEFAETIAWIEKINSKEFGADKEETKRYQGARNRRWLTALKPGTEACKLLKDERENIYKTWFDGKISDHPEFDNYSSVTFGHTYPLEFGELKKMSVSEQIIYINGFVPDHSQDHSERGLAELLRIAVIDDPFKYQFVIHKFLSVKAIYFIEVLTGFTETLKMDKNIDISLIFNFIEVSYFNKEIWEKENNLVVFKRWFASDVSEFISTVISRHEQLNLTTSDFEQIFSLLLGILGDEDLPDDTNDNGRSYLDQILNNVLGRLYMTLMNAVEVWADKFVEKTSLVKWPASMKAHFINQIALKDDCKKDFSLILGMELPLIRRLDGKWMDDNIESILDEKNDVQYSYRLHMIFSGYYRITKDQYEFLKKNNAFDKALRYFVSESTSLDVVMLYSLLEWKMWGGDPEKDSILSKILERRDSLQIKRFIYAAWKNRILTPIEAIYLVEKLLPIFEELPELSEQYSTLLWLFESIPELSEQIFDLSSIIIEKTKPGDKTYKYLKNLFEGADSNLDLTGKLVFQMYSRNLVGLFLQDELKQLVKKLYESDFKVTADEICIVLGNKGSIVLRELYNQYN